MNATDFAAKGGRKLLSVLEKYKFVLLVALAGVLLLLLPTANSGEDQSGGTDPPALSFDLEGLEHKLAETLSQVEGAGKVSVVLTVKASTRQVLAQDSSLSKSEGTSQEEKSTVVVSKGSGREETVPLQQIYPMFQGALVVCPGGGDPAVQLELMEAVSALTGLGTDKISICKAK